MNITSTETERWWRCVIDERQCSLTQADVTIPGVRNETRNEARDRLAFIGGRSSRGQMDRVRGTDRREPFARLATDRAFGAAWYTQNQAQPTPSPLARRGPRR